MSNHPRLSTVSAHDLRHLLALLACDLGLTRERLRRDQASLSDRYPALLLRLAAGLRRCDALLSGQAVASASPAAAADRSLLLQSLWDQYLRAGRLKPEASRLELCRPWHLPGPTPALHSLVLNLLENACAAAPAGPVELRADAAGLEIANGGETMPRELAEGLERGEAPSPSGGRGQGLGLILRASRQLELNLRVERNSRVTRIHLERETGAGPRLLLVEDDGELRQMLAELLRLEGFRVTPCESAEDLPQSRGRYAAVVADLNLPGAKGDALLGAWKRADPDLRTILLTGESEAQDRRWPGVDCVVVKPGLQRLLAELQALPKAPA